MKLGLWLVAVLLPLYLRDERVDRQHGRSANEADTGQPGQTQKANAPDHDGCSDQECDSMVGHT